MNAISTIVVILGFPAESSNNPGPILKARLDKGIELYKQGLGAKIIVTGGAVGNEFTESEVMATYCMQHGVLQQDILVESFAKNTFENARLVRDIMKEKGYTNAIVVTSSFHAMRAKTFFARVVGNIKIVAAPFPSNFSVLKRAFLLGKEYIIMILYSLGMLNGRYSIKKSH